MQARRQRVERSYEALLRARCLRVRLRGQPEARGPRERAARPSPDAGEAVPVVAIGLDRMLQRLLEEREDIVCLLRRSLETAELLEDALAVVGHALDSLAGRVRGDRAVESGREGGGDLLPSLRGLIKDVLDAVDEGPELRG